MKRDDVARRFEDKVKRLTRAVVSRIGELDEGERERVVQNELFIKGITIKTVASIGRGAIGELMDDSLYQQIGESVERYVRGILKENRRKERAKLEETLDDRLEKLQSKILKDRRTIKSYIRKNTKNHKVRERL